MYIFLVCNEVCLQKEKACKEENETNICGAFTEFNAFY